MHISSHNEGSSISCLLFNIVHCREGVFTAVFSGREDRNLAALPERTGYSKPALQQKVAD
jgi:hypothetical protein